MKDTVYLKEVLKVVKQNKWVIVSSTLITLLIGAAIAFFLITPTYQATSQILINQTNKDKESVIQTAEVQANLQLVNTYRVLISSPRILEKVVKQEKKPITIEALSKKIDVKSEQDSQIINLYVKDSDPATAARLVNEITKVSKEMLPQLMQVDNIQVVSTADNPSELEIVSFQPPLILFVSFVIGLLIGLMITVLRYFLDTTIRDERDIEEALHLPLFGAVSVITEKEMRTKH